MRAGRPDVAVVFLGILTEGALADVSNYLLDRFVLADQAIDRIRPVVGDAELDALDRPWRGDVVRRGHRLRA